MAKGRKTGGGLRTGSPNKATATLKEAIAHVLDSTQGQCLGWLQSVADGEKEYRFDDTGKAERDEKGNHLFDWVRRPEPATALKLWTDMAEFALPKLARTELTGEGGGAVKIQGTVEFVSSVQRPVS